MPTTAPADETAASGTALLIIDMLSRWDFEDAGRLLPAAAAITPAIAALAGRCRASGVPVIYANDNHGRWRSDLHEVIDAAIQAGGDGAVIARQLAPHDTDYVVLKPKHSAFHATPLALLLRHLKVQRLILTGVSSDQCVLVTAADARMNDLEVVVPCDCIATQSEDRNRRALQQLAEAQCIETPPADELLLPAGPSKGRHHAQGKD